MIDISKAVEIIINETPKLGSEKCGISDSVGRILHENIIADTDLPPFDRSQMDGYAVVAVDVKNAPVTLRLVGESAAGKGWHKTINSGETVAIMTGAPVPKGADAIQKIELTHLAGSSVQILSPVGKGSFIVRKGNEIKKGTSIFKAGEVITENMIATLAAFGYAKITVGTQPKVLILGTGSEIVEISKKPDRDQIRNSNSVMLDVLCRKIGAETTIQPIAKDEISDLKSHISDAIGITKTSIHKPQPDVLIITGGVSVGKYDHTKSALAELKTEIFFDKVRLKPGKPAVFARLGKTLVFGLPGNPVSAAVTFHLFVRTAILAMQGAKNITFKKAFALVATDARAARERDTYLPSRLETNALGELVAHPLKWQGSSDFVGFAQADSLIYVRRGEEIKAGEVARIVYL